MAGPKHIRAVGREASRTSSAEAAEPANIEAPEVPGDEGPGIEDAAAALDLGDYEAEDIYEDEPVADHRRGWIAPALAIAAIVAWTAFYGYAIRGELLVAGGAAPSEWARWLIDWSVPALLVGVVWLLAMRHSHSEARRFGDTAAMLSRESRELESRLKVVNRELSLAREFLGAQSRELETLGRIAGERISTHADHLQDLIRDNGAQVEAIGSASESALANMTRLRDDLPVIANSARDVTNQVGAAGRTADEQLTSLVGGFERLNNFNTETGKEVAALEKQIAAALEDMGGQLARIEEVAGNRLAAITRQTRDYRSTVEDAEGAAIEALSDRMAMLQTETKAIAGSLREAEAGAIEQLVQSKKRFEAEIGGTIDTLDKLDAQAITASQERIKKLNAEVNRFGDELIARDRQFIDLIAQRQEEFETREAQASEVLAQRLADLDDALATRREAQIEETRKLVDHTDAISGELDRLSALMGEIDSQGEATRAGLTAGFDGLGEQLAAKRAQLKDTEAQIGELTEAGVRLLEIIQSGARTSREELPSAMEEALAKLGSVEERAEAVSNFMLSTREGAEGLTDVLAIARGDIEMADREIADLHTRLREQSDDALARIEGLRGGFARLTADGETYAGETQDALRAALGELEDAARATFDTLENGSRERVSAIAGAISGKAAGELERALENHATRALGDLEKAAAGATGAGREATVQLRDQLAKVNELTRNLEQRIARAREVAQEQVGNDFARRMALITDSLNSNAIDIASVLSSEVSDTAWDAYLKGDRGIFTRRAVRLVDNGDARTIAELYQHDDTFKGNVTRYIHDFEAMLRQMLSTRDGNALGVTLLGSDAGKLYVVLAQSIERLRQ
ncbi:ATPase [Erythrobacter sp.]|jgi:hypothetical protein|uniref:ATPase n=1 Tax=Erythrobacter sp. TaxID=1042 RepID=UPI002EC79293|nr:ATPase [Erythrobacter sp.]